MNKLNLRFSPAGREKLFLFFAAVLMAAPLRGGSLLSGTTTVADFAPYFFDDFESRTVDAKLPVPYEAAGRSRATGEQARRGTKSARMEILPGDGGGFGQWGVVLPLAPALGKGSEVWVRLYVYWPASFQFTASPWMKFLRFHTKSGTSSANTGYNDLYIDKADTTTSVLRTIKEVDDNWAVYDGPAIPRDRWECYEMYLKVDNTSVDHGGQGRVRVWRDGQLIFNRTDVPTIVTAQDLVDYFYLFTYWNNEKPPSNHCYVDDLAIATSASPPTQTDVAGNRMIGTWLPAPAAIAPAIATQPANQIVSSGRDATFTVVASGTAPLTYQWRKDGVEIPSATNVSVVVASVQGSDVGSYAVLVGNSVGSVTSNAATLSLGIPPAGFDVGAYLTRYPDVAAIYNSDPYGAWLYYRNHGIYQGEVFDEEFRVEEYLALYPDLLAIFGTDLGGALEHWLSTGRIEGRLGRIPSGFSAAGYFSRNPDVATAVNNDPVLGWQHFWLYGIYEGRAYDDEFRAFEYLALNPDLQAAFLSDWRGATLHWLRYGCTEGRLGRIPLIFRSTEYLARYPDVAVVWGTYPTTVWQHYWLYGIDEGRSFDNEFRADDYLSLNPDLVSIFGTDRRGAFKHWVRYGRAEGRLAIKSVTTTLPIEVLGQAGTIEQAILDLQSPTTQVSYLWLRTHRLAWREDGEFADTALPRGTVRPGSKGSVRLNGGGWVPLTNATVVSEGQAGALGGLNGAYMTVPVRLPVAALGSPGLHTGTNTLEFRFDATDGISMGWRVLGFDLRSSADASLLTNHFVWDNPDTWTAPLDTPADISAGRTLWGSADLTDLGFSNTLHPIRSKCASCHARDGFDLAYFNYSNRSIVQRSVFHGLSETQGNQIASYIRSLDLKLPGGYTRKDAGRPWNPPYQPGPGLDGKPVELWAAGAGLDAVLENDSEMKAYLFPGGQYHPEILAATGFLNPRETPQALQYPDWNTWLPTAGLEDLVADPVALPASQQILKFKQVDDWLSSYRWTSMTTDQWYMSVGLFYVQVWMDTRLQSLPGENWYTDRTVPTRTKAQELAQGRHNLARTAWFNVRQFELITKYRLDNVTEQGGAGGTPEVPAGYRSWGMPFRTVFETAPHFVTDHPGLTFNFTQPGNYLSTSWYSLEQIFNGGYHAGAFGLDWNYHPFHIMGMHHGGTGFYTDGPIHAYRAAWSLIWMYQSIPTIDWRQDPAPAWTPKSFGFSQRQFGLGLDPAYGTDELVAQGKMTTAERAQLQESLVLAFLGIAERYTPDQWARRTSDDSAHRTAENFETVDYVAHFDPFNSYDLPERGFQADAYYLRIKQLKEQNLLTPQTYNRLLSWARGVWPKGEWSFLSL